MSGVGLGGWGRRSAVGEASQRRSEGGSTKVSRLERDRRARILAYQKLI